jgi:site-specific DNA recombinase
MRAAIYCRVSTVEQAQNLSLDTQEKACRDYCARNSYDVAEVFVDAGESAKTTNRPEFLRLLAACRAQRGRLHAVVVYSLTRFSRNTADHHTIVTLLRGLGIALRSVTEPIDDSPSGRLMEGILASMAQFDNDVRSERVTAGMKAAVERGRWVWPAPLGYRNGPRGGPSLVPDPDRAPAVREAFELASRGITGRDLLTRLHALGLTTKTGLPLSFSRLYEMLRQPVYAGYIRQAAWRTDRRGDFAPLVSDEVFTQVQVRMTRPAAPSAAPLRAVHPDFPLKRFVRCGTCGKPLTASWSRGRAGTRYGFYHCKGGGKGGRCTNIARQRLETAFLALLDRLRPQPGYWAVLQAAVLDTWREAQRHAGQAAAAARRRVATIEAKLTRLEDAFIYQRALEEAAYHARRAELREQIAVARLEAAEADVDELDVEGLLAFAEHTLTHASALWTAAGSIDEKVRLQTALFPRGLVWQFEHFEEPVNCLEFFGLAEREGSEKGLVDLTGIEPVTS